MKLTFFDNERDSDPKPSEGDWADLVSLLRECRTTECSPCASLAGGPNKCEHRKGVAWSPAHWPEGSRRLAGAVTGADFLVFDLDHITAETLASVLTRLDMAGYAAILHSTHSHRGDADGAYRLVLRAERTLTPGEIIGTRAALEAELGLPVDPQTKDLGRLYYLPSRAAEALPFVFAETDGRAVTPVAGLAPAPAPTSLAMSAASAAPRTVSGEAIDLATIKGELSAKVRQNPLVQKVLKGERLAEAGGRDSAIQSVMSALVFGLVRYGWEVAVELARPSLLALEPDPPNDWVEIAKDKAARAWERREAERIERERKAEVARHMLARESAAANPDKENPNNAEPYTVETVERWAKEAGIEGGAEGFKKNWIIRHHGGNWVWCNGSYSSVVPDKDLEVSIRRDLARAPVALTQADKNGDLSPRRLSLVLWEHGTTARSVAASLALRRSWYDSKAQCFHEAVCPLRTDIGPVFHAEIDTWLGLFGGDVLLDWVAAVTMLDKPAAALYIDGPPGTGKNVLADGLARLWHKGGASSLKNVIASNFNDTLTRCPLVYADEGIPKTDTIMDDLRALIGSSTRELNRKFMPVVSIDGCPRLLITANNDRALLDTGATLGPQDIEAVAMRIRQLHAGQPAADYLAELRQANGYSHIEAWKTGDKLAEHALWLYENRRIDTTTRFLVEGVDAGQAERMLTGTGHVGAVLEFLARYLSDSSAIKNPRIDAGGGRLYVNTEALADKYAWERYVPSRKIPSAKVISEALRSISASEPVERSGFWFFDVKPHILTEWCKSNQVGSPTMITAKLNEAKP